MLFRSRLTPDQSGWEHFKMESKPLFCAKFWPWYHVLITQYKVQVLLKSAKIRMIIQFNPIPKDRHVLSLSIDGAVQWEKIMGESFVSRSWYPNAILSIGPRNKPDVSIDAAIRHFYVNPQYIKPSNV